MKALLIHSAEEAGEFVHAAMKFARGHTGSKNLTEEAADVAALITVLTERGAIDAEKYSRRYAGKLKKMRGKYGRK